MRLVNNDLHRFNRSSFVNIPSTSSPVSGPPRLSSRTPNLGSSSTSMDGVPTNGVSMGIAVAACSFVVALPGIFKDAQHESKRKSNKNCSVMVARMGSIKITKLYRRDVVS